MDVPELPQGTLDLLILQALTWGPCHGYAVARLLQKRSGGALTIEDGSIYPALYRMENRGWIESEWGTSELGRDAKFYSLTPKGRAQLAREIAQWSALTKAVGRILRTRHA